MVVQSATLMRDTFFFIKDDLNSNITDPIAGSRTGSSAFVMTSFPQRNVKYPLVTIKIINVEATRSGMQSTMMDVTLSIEIRIWGRNEKEKDEVFNEIYERLRSIQFTGATGSVANNLHDFALLSAVEVDEEGERGIKSRIAQFEYRFFNLT